MLTAFELPVPMLTALDLPLPLTMLLLLKLHENIVVRKLILRNGTRRTGKKKNAILNHVAR